MTAPEVLERITAAGVTLTARDGSLVAKPRAAVTPEVLALMRAHKPELLAAIMPKPINGGDSAELTALVHQVADHNRFSYGDRQEALKVALADPIAALECFRALAEGMPTYTLPIDDRRFCTECVNLRGRYCAVEKREQVLDILQRCPTFKQRKLH